MLSIAQQCAYKGKAFEPVNIFLQSLFIEFIKKLVKLECREMEIVDKDLFGLQCNHGCQGAVDSFLKTKTGIPSIESVHLKEMSDVSLTRYF